MVHSDHQRNVKLPSLLITSETRLFIPETESESNCRIIRFDSVELNRIEFQI